MNLDKLRKIVTKLPPAPGVYFFKGPEDNNIYIGKAGSLKSRVLSYLKTNDRRICKMVDMATSFKFTTTTSDIEALILESQYIKKHRPMFNIVMRDDKQYGFVAFTKDKYPKIYITHQPQSLSTYKLKSLRASYIGPFTDVGALQATLRYLRNIFPYCTCKQLHNNYCLNYHIGKCPGFCCLKDNPGRLVLSIIEGSPRTAEEKTYKTNIKAIKEVLSGKRNSLIQKLEKEMIIKAQTENFEEAIGMRIKLERLKRIFENVRIIKDLKIMDGILSDIKESLALDKLPLRIECYDISNIQGDNATGSMVVFENGKSNTSEYRKFKIKTVRGANDTAMLKEVLMRRLNHPEWPMPDLIIVDGGKQQLHVAKKVIKNITIIALTKGEKHIGIKLTTEKGEIPLSALPENVKNLILRVDSEAHRFAINYYRHLHRKSLKETR